MNRWTSRAGLAAAGMVATVGLVAGVARSAALAPEGETTTVEIGPPPPAPSAATTAPLPPPRITPIEVPAAIIDASRSTASGGSLSQTIAVVVLRVDPPDCRAEGLILDSKCRH